MTQPGTGSTIAGYRLEEPIGRGGMGVVYLATHLALDKRVALKLIAEDLYDDEGFRERFRREPRLAASIDHPNVIPVHDAGEDGGHLFVAMRYVDGDDLGTTLRREGRIEPRRAAAIVAQVAAALEAAHDLGLVHRDVKPANVLIESRRGGEHAYLTDFGIARAGGSSASLTRTGQWIGTIDYVAPEQIEGGKIDGRTDIYALGAVLYHLLSGSAPYARDSEVAKIYAHLSKPPPSAAEVDASVPKDLDSTINRAMAKDPGDRYPTAGEFANDVLAAVTDEGEISKQTQVLAEQRTAGGESSAPDRTEPLSSVEPQGEGTFAARTKLSGGERATSQPRATRVARDQESGSGALGGLAQFARHPTGRWVIAGGFAAILALAVVLVVLSSGSESTPSGPDAGPNQSPAVAANGAPEETSGDSFLAEADQVCDAEDQAIERVAEPFKGSGTQQNLELRIPIERDALARLRQLNVPTALADTYDRYLDAKQRKIEAANDVLAASQAKGGKTEFKTARDAQLALNDETRTRADAVGFSVCGQGQG